MLLKRRFPTAGSQWPRAGQRRDRQARRVLRVRLCELCPVDAKFAIQNGLAWVYSDPRVTLQLDSAVDIVETAAGIAQCRPIREAAPASTPRPALVVLAASALFNPHILLRSGVRHPLLGKRLHEQMPIDVTRIWRRQIV